MSIKDVAVIGNIIKSLDSPLKGKTLPPEETEKMLDKINETIDEFDARKFDLKVEINMKVSEYKRPSLTETEKEVIFQQWQMLMEQYEAYSMLEGHLKTIKGKIDIAKTTVDFGDAMNKAFTLVKHYTTQTPDLDRLLKEYTKVMGRVNSSFDGLDRFDKAMKKKASDTDTGTSRFTKEQFMALVNKDETTSNEPAQAKEQDPMESFFANVMMPE